MLKEYLCTLANAFRIVLGTTDKINAQDFSNKVNEVYESGKQAEWSEFWDNLQDYGKRTHYLSGFAGASATVGKYWNDNNFQPKYDMQPTNANRMFAYSGIKDLAKILKDCNVKLDFSKCTNMAECFSYSTITHIPELDVRNFDTVNIGTYNMYSLVTIDKVILREDGSQTFASAQTHLCSNLQNILFEGVIGNDITLSNSKLTVKSLLNIIEHLQDITETSKTCTLTIGTTNLKKLTDEEKAIATQKGWTLA